MFCLRLSTTAEPSGPDSGRVAREVKLFPTWSSTEHVLTSGTVQEKITKFLPKKKKYIYILINVTQIKIATFLPPQLFTPIK